MSRSRAIVKEKKRVLADEERKLVDLVVLHVARDWAEVDPAIDYAIAGVLRYRAMVAFAEGTDVQLEEDLVEVDVVATIKPKP